MVFSQVDSTWKYVKYQYSNGITSSEGYLHNGMPDGYWKSYFENGSLKSEGNRRNFKIDSTWKFCSEDSTLQSEINYSNGLKNGIRRTYLKNEIIEDYFENDIRDLYSKSFYPDGKIKRFVPFEKGLENGLGFEYNQDGVIILISEYKKGFLITREYINRRDKNGLRQGLWKDFYENGKTRQEITYINDKRNGYLKKYDENGVLLSIEKYINDEPVLFAEELKEYEIRRDYYPSGKVKIEGSYFDNVADGVRREYDENGNIVKGYVFSEGVVIGEGIIDAMGKKQGDWKEFYESGELMANGVYKNNVRVGKWTFFHRNGKIEQEGVFTSKGLPDGDWKYYYENGNTLIEEEFVNGENEGSYVEYSDSGTVLVKGEYFEGLQTGEWLYAIGDVVETGKYKDGEQDGVWTRISKDDGELVFKGEFFDGQPTGRHIWYFENGNKRLEGVFVLGLREGDWKYYSPDGTLSLIVTYRQGMEIKYNNILIKPEIDPITD